MKSTRLFIILSIILLMGLGTFYAHANETLPNWCYEGQPWGDGRCNNQPTAADNTFMWQCGYYVALMENTAEEDANLNFDILTDFSDACFDKYVATAFPEWVIVEAPEQNIVPTTCTIVDDDAGTLTVPLNIINGDDPNNSGTIGIMTNSPSGFDWVDNGGDTTLLYDKSGDGFSGAGDDSMYTEFGGWAGDILSTDCPMPTLPF